MVDGNLSKVYQVREKLRTNVPVKTTQKNHNTNLRRANIQKEGPEDRVHPPKIKSDVIKCQSTSNIMASRIANILFLLRKQIVRILGDQQHKKNSTTPLKFTKTV